MMFLPMTWRLLYLLLCCIIMCLGAPISGKMRTATREVIAFFNDYGTLIDVYSVPKCESGGKINLLKYSYHQMECPSVLPSHCTSVREDELLPEEELLLHKECSFRTVCTTLRYPTRLATLENKFNALSIKFQCIGQNSTFLDICEKRNLYFNDTLHLTLTDDTQFTDCRCWVNHGPFTMSLNDIRLTQKTESKCSPSELRINEELWSCDERKEEGFGSIFNEYIRPEEAFVALVSKSENISPDMVWLIIYPDDTSRIYCEGDVSSQNHAPDKTSSTQTYSEQPETSQRECEDDYSCEKHAPDTTTPTPNSVRSTLTPRSTVPSSTQTYAEQPDTSTPTVIKSDTTQDTTYISVIAFLSGIILCFVVFIIICCRKASLQQGPQKAVKRGKCSENNLNFPSSTDNIPERQSQDPLLLRILHRIEYISNQFRIRTNEQDRQTAGQQINGVNSATYLQRQQQKATTDFGILRDNKSHQQRKFSSLPNLQIIEAVPFDEQIIHNRPQDSLQKPAVVQYSQEDDKTKEKQLFLDVLDDLGRSMQLSERGKGPVAQCNTEKNTPASLRRHLTYESSGGEDEMSCSDIEANITDIEVEQQNIPLLNKTRTTSNVSDSTNAMAHATSADNSGLLPFPTEINGSLDQKPLRGTELDIREPLIRQPTITDTDESTSFTYHSIDLSKKSNGAKRISSLGEKRVSK